ncbi:hypothetical protein [Bifidobacterium choloepi]|nr:hypothetical protein [Bifidobacterium choloepi]
MAYLEQYRDNGLIKVLTLNHYDTGITDEGIRIEYAPEWLLEEE